MGKPKVSRRETFNLITSVVF